MLGSKQSESEVRADYIGLFPYLKPNRCIADLPRGGAGAIPAGAPKHVGPWNGLAASAAQISGER